MRMLLLMVMVFSGVATAMADHPEFKAISEESVKKDLNSPEARKAMGLSASSSATVAEEKSSTMKPPGKRVSKPPVEIEEISAAEDAPRARTSSRPEDHPQRVVNIDGRDGRGEKAVDRPYSDLALVHQPKAAKVRVRTSVQPVVVYSPPVTYVTRPVVVRSIPVYRPPVVTIYPTPIVRFDLNLSLGNSRHCADWVRYPQYRSVAVCRPPVWVERSHCSSHRFRR